MYNNLFEDFEDLMTLGFGTKPLMVRYTTPSTKDVAPAANWKKEDDTYSTVVRVVGINEDDVEVSLEDYGIYIKGESQTFGETYSQEVKLGIAKDLIANIDTVKYEVKNGMCKIVLEMREPEYRKVSVNKTTFKEVESKEEDDK